MDPASLAMESRLHIFRPALRFQQLFQAILLHCSLLHTCDHIKLSFLPAHYYYTYKYEGCGLRMIRGEERCSESRHMFSACLSYETY